ncbi:MAG: TM2 domain-containing protein [Planctomycetota bacterium]|jgi:TM2 domain-containing membrane protein YozV
MNENNKSTGVAYLLWFFLGCWGGHRFYLGRKGSGLGMAGLWLGSLVTTPIVIGFIGFLALFGWWIVDAFCIGKWIAEESSPHHVMETPGTADEHGSTPATETSEEPVHSAAA